MKNVYWGKYFVAFLITLFVFVSGLYAGEYTSNLKFKSLFDLQNKIRSEVLGTEIQYQIVENELCSHLEKDLFMEELYKIGSRLTAMESQLGVDNEAVISLKEYYHLLEIRHYLFMKQAKQKCSLDHGLVLYFYSNAGDCKECEEQGYLLSYVHKRQPAFNIYSFDVNIDNPAIRTLKKYYNITKVPSVVINEKTYSGFQDKENLYKILLPNKIISEE